MFETRARPHFRKLRQPVKSLKSGIQKIQRGLLIVSSDKVPCGNSILIRFR